MEKHLQEDKWLSEVLERQVYKLNLPEEWLPQWWNKYKWGENGLKHWGEHLPPSSFIYSKVPVLEVQTTGILQKLGFYLVDTQVTFEKPNVYQSRINRTDMEVRSALPTDESGVCSLASAAFRYSRFHLDPLIPQQFADRIKAEWVANYFRGKRGDALVVALNNGKIVGFLQLLFNKEEKVLVIDLIAVDENVRGRGIAAAMINYAEQSFSAYERMIVGTQVANVPSVRLYEKLGFRLRSAHYVYHYHHQLQ